MTHVMYAFCVCDEASGSHGQPETTFTSLKKPACSACGLFAFLVFLQQELLSISLTLFELDGKLHHAASGPHSATNKVSSGHVNWRSLSLNSTALQRVSTSQQFSATLAQGMELRQRINSSLGQVCRQELKHTIFAIWVSSRNLRLSIFL